MSARLLIVALLALAGCDSTASGDRPFLTRTFRTADGTTAHYVLFVPPDRDPDEKLPVILFLNGWGENGNDGLRQISNNFGGDMWRMRGWFPFLAVCPQCSYNAEWKPGSPNEQIALGVLEEAIREFNGDPACVAITGASTGGKGALEIALANRNRFSAIVPVSTSIHLPPDQVAASRLAIWNFYNSGDTPSLVLSARLGRKRQFEAGSSPLVTEFDLAGHNAWDPAYSSPALYRWLLRQRRDSAPSQFPFQLLQPGKILAQWTHSPKGGWTADGDDFVGQAGTPPATLTSPPLGNDFEVHFDAQMAPGLPVVCRLVGHGEQTAELQLVLSADGVARLIRPDEPPIVIDPAAQRALRAGWNDIRLHCTGGQIGLSLNGWTAIDAAPLPVSGPVRFALVGGSEATPQRFRYVRLGIKLGQESQP